MIEGFSTSISDQDNLAKFITSLDQEVQRRGIEYGECMWDTYLGKVRDDLNALEAQIAELMLDPDHLETVKAWRDKVDDPTLSRLLFLFERALTSAQVGLHEDVFKLKNEINSEVIQFRPTVRGKMMERSDLRELIRNDPNRDLRREGYYSNKVLHDTIVERSLELMKVRNSRARDLGYRDLIDLDLPITDIDKDEILTLFERLEAGTRDRYFDFLHDAAYKEGYDRVQPWDVAYLIQKRISLPKEAFPKDKMLGWTKEMVDSLGFAKDDFSNIHVEFGDIPFGGVCFGIDPPKDIRVLLNPRDGHEYVKTLFHEFGHALQSRYVPEEHHIAKEDTGPPFGEGMAEFLEGIAEEKNWLLTHTELSSEEIDRYREARAIERISWLRSLMASATFEFELVNDHDRDLDALSHQIAEKFVVVPEEPSRQWAAQSIFVTHPLYVYSYVFADCLAAQMRAKIGSNGGEINGNMDIAPFLIETCFKPGGYVSWREKVENATGVDVRVDELLVELRNDT